MTMSVVATQQLTDLLSMLSSEEPLVFEPTELGDSVLECGSPIKVTGTEDMGAFLASERFLAKMAPVVDLEVVHLACTVVPDVYLVLDVDDEATLRLVYTGNRLKKRKRVEPPTEETRSKRSKPSYGRFEDVYIVFVYFWLAYNPGKTIDDVLDTKVVEKILQVRPDRRKVVLENVKTRCDGKLDNLPQEIANCRYSGYSTSLWAFIMMSLTAIRACSDDCVFEPSLEQKTRILDKATQFDVIMPKSLERLIQQVRSVIGSIVADIKYRFPSVDLSRLANTLQIDDE